MKSARFWQILAIVFAALSGWLGWQWQSAKLALREAASPALQPVPVRSLLAGNAPPAKRQKPAPEQAAAPPSPSDGIHVSRKDLADLLRNWRPPLDGSLPAGLRWDHAQLRVLGLNEQKIAELEAATKAHTAKALALMKTKVRPANMNEILALEESTSVGVHSDTVQVFVIPNWEEEGQSIRRELETTIRGLAGDSADLLIELLDPNLDAQASLWGKGSRTVSFEDLADRGWSIKEKLEVGSVISTSSSFSDEKEIPAHWLELFQLKQ